jgi:hypothetical protein
VLRKVIREPSQVESDKYHPADVIVAVVELLRKMYRFVPVAGSIQ